MARFESATEIFDVWVEDSRVHTRRFRRGEPPPAPTSDPVPVDMDMLDDDSARQRYCAQQRNLLSGGWQRVHDPDHEPTYPGDPIDDALERALHANPDDDETWLVYADHYIHRGHPRGQLMAIESAPVKNIVQRAEREAETRKLRIAANAVLGGPLLGRAGVNLSWKRGFIHRAIIRGLFERGAAEDLLFELFTHPSGRMLRELVCERNAADDYHLFVDLLLHLPPPPLARLEILHAESEWSAAPSLGDLGALGTRYPLLEHVELECDNTLELAGLALPRAKTFVLRTKNLRPRTAEQILDGPWPLLEQLELVIGHQSACRFADLAPIFDGSVELPHLTWLAIEEAQFGQELVRAFVHSAMAKRLRRLGLRGTPFDDDAAELLLAARADLHPELEIAVDRSRLTEATWNQLRRADLINDRYW